MPILIVEVDPLHQAIVIVKICFESQMLQNGTVFKIKIYVILLIFRCHDIQINDGSGKVSTTIQFKSDSPQTVVVEACFPRKIHDLFDLSVLLFRKLVVKVLPDIFRCRVIKAEMIVKTARPVNNIAVQTVQFVAGHDE